MPDFESVYKRYFADVYKYVLALSGGDVGAAGCRRGRLPAGVPLARRAFHFSLMGETEPKEHV